MKLFLNSRYILVQKVKSFWMVCEGVEADLISEKQVFHEVVKKYGKIEYFTIVYNSIVEELAKDAKDLMEQATVVMKENTKSLLHLN